MSELRYDGSPTLGFLAADWIEAHCVVPDGDFLGSPFILDGWQLYCTVEFYKVRPGSVYDPAKPLRNRAFVFRRAAVVGPQKTGKGPWSASMVLFEAVGPCLFAGWAEEGETYECADHGCNCGFVFTYEEGDPKGIPRMTSKIQLVATSEEQVDNIYDPVKMMATLGPLNGMVKPLEGMIRLPNDGKIEPVSASANSKLGNPINFAVMDETGLYTKQNKLLKVAQTMARGLGGMGGRSLETSNAWDPMESSRAQLTFASKRDDIFRFFRQPPQHLKFELKRDRMKILKHVYEGSHWVDLESVNAEAEELLETDPAQAKRFYGNMLVQGQGAYLLTKTIDRSQDEMEIGKDIVLGFDGSRSGDWTALRAETKDGHRFTPTYTVGGEERTTVWKPEEWGGQIPRSEVHAAVRQLFKKYKIKRFYCDPFDWRTEIEEWALEFSDDVVIQWPTNKIDRMWEALVRYRTDMSEGISTHDGENDYILCATNARMSAKAGDKFILAKPSDHQKIDVLMADVLAHEAACDARASGWTSDKDDVMFMFR
ncbi:hypothetical protein [Timonella senegalensis]|uniref:hypothetical protein n=1 Tax=Timonella senegalensis TaxID=1465825 RepID=UPI0028AB2D98|nr:hypothetical protein [Timonella senegalensis]